MSPYGGLVVFLHLFKRLGLARRLRWCFAHESATPIYGRPVVVLWLVVHLLLGFRRLREVEYYRDDAVVLRSLGLRRLPSVPTLCRTLAGADERGLDNLRATVRELVLERLATEQFDRVTLDFDGTVVHTRGHAEGTAVGYNKAKKGRRSYYSLMCTVAQTGQFLDLLHRSGNVHDSKGAKEFMICCIDAVRRVLPNCRIEVRTDSAFFAEEVVAMLHGMGVEFTCSVPFHRFAELKGFIEQRKRWRPLANEQAYFEKPWKPKKWKSEWRFLFVRQTRATQIKGPLQLDLFEPRDTTFEYKVIVVNHDHRAEDALPLHDGRGGQEKIFAEAKQHAALDVIATRFENANRMFTLASLLAHNLGRELQLAALPERRTDGPTRKTCLAMRSLGTLRRTIVLRASRLVRPARRLVIRIAVSHQARHEMERFLRGLARRHSKAA